MLLNEINYPTNEKTEITISDEPINLVDFFALGQSDKKRLFVTDATVASLPSVIPFAEKFTDSKCGNDSILMLGSGEPYKTIETVLSIVKVALEAGLSRDDAFVAIGGGVVCDTVGFAASIFKRGIDVEFVPTTLLAMVDASIGGKTGVDFENYKNMIGTFFPAKKIHILTKFLDSLSDEQYNSGLAEAFKTALLFDEELFVLFKNEVQKINERNQELLNTIITKCVKAKSAVVQNDFHEKGERSFLNLGHTFAHALESVVGFGNITHGKAVAWGIGRAIDISNKLELCNASYKDEINSILKLYNWETSPIPTILKNQGAGMRLLEVMKNDKKNTSHNIRLVLQNGLMQTVLQNVNSEEILNVLK